MKTEKPERITIYLDAQASATLDTVQAMLDISRSSVIKHLLYSFAEEKGLARGLKVAAARKVRLQFELGHKKPPLFQLTTILNKVPTPDRPEFRDFMRKSTPKRIKILLNDIKQYFALDYDVSNKIARISDSYAQQYMLMLCNPARAWATMRVQVPHLMHVGEIKEELRPYIAGRRIVHYRDFIVSDEQYSDMFDHYARTFIYVHPDGKFMTEAEYSEHDTLRLPWMSEAEHAEFLRSAAEMEALYKKQI